MIAENRYSIVSVDVSVGGRTDLFDLDTAAEHSGMHPEMIREFGRAHFVSVAYVSASGSPYFDRDGLSRLRQIERLRQRQRANLHTIQTIMQLQDRLAAVECELAAILGRGQAETCR